MKLAEVVQFDSIDFDKTDVPEYITTIEKEYDEQMKSHNYILEQTQYDEFAGKWSRIHDWLAVQYARAKYQKKSLENKLELILMKERAKAPEECKTDKAKERWVQQNSVEYQGKYEELAKSEGYFAFFERKIDAAKMNHYLCKGMSSSIDKDKPVGGFSS